MKLAHLALRNWLKAADVLPSLTRGVPLAPIRPLGKRNRDRQGAERVRNPGGLQHEDRMVKMREARFSDRDQFAVLADGFYVAGALLAY